MLLSAEQAPSPEAVGMFDDTMCLDVPPVWVEHLLPHLDWQTRANLFTLNKKWLALGVAPGIWRKLATLLAVEATLYLPPTLAWSTAEARKLFSELWRLRKQWTVQEEESPAVVAGATFFSITVCARFRRAAEQSVGVAPPADPVVLPLHQRVQLIQASRKGGMSCTRVEAFRIIMREQGRTPVEDPWGDAAVRHLQQHEGKQKATARRQRGAEGASRVGRAHKAQVLALNQPPGSVLTVAPHVGLRPFHFDRVFEPHATQQGVYEQAAQRVVVDVMNGLDSSIIVYGQTGSGKTFTMFGPERAMEATEPSALDARDAGIVPRACQELFAAAAERRPLGIETTVEVSFVEVFGHEVNDLLRERAGVGRSRVAGQRYVLDGTSAEAVQDMPQLLALLRRGHLQKRQAATAMNERSSRAHSLVVVGVRQRCASSGVRLEARLFLADLGGSEKLSQSHANADMGAVGTLAWAEYYRARERLMETTNINQGLFALKKCIDALNDQAKALEEGRPSPYVPYQDSKLTLLLSSALGGSSKTLVIVTGSMDTKHAVETVQTLRFAERCANVLNKSTLSARALQETLEALDREIEDTEALVQKHERWESRRVVRRDVDGDEMINVTELVGAEVHRERLEHLLHRKRELLGEEAPAATTLPSALTAVAAVALGATLT